MGMITGQGAVLQLGQESSWGTKVSPTVALNFTSEAFKPGVERKEEDSLVGQATSSGFDIMAKNATFSWEQLAKPENIGFVLGCALGVEETVEENGDTGTYKHTFKLLKPALNASLKKFTAVVNRHVHVKAYTGCKIDTLKISCAQKDYMRLSVSGKAKAEETATVVSSLAIPNKKGFKFIGGSVSVDNTDFADVTSIEWNLSNNLDDGEQTTGSGIYGTEPEPQKRSVTATLGCLFTSNANTIRENKFVQDATSNVVLRFESPEDAASGTKYSVSIKMPLFVLDSCDANVESAEKLKMTMSGTAIEDSSNEAVTIELIDSKNSKYTN